MTESRQRGRIRKAVESRGYRVESLMWEPLYDGGEKSGTSGGWTVILDRTCRDYSSLGNELFGLNADEVLAEIDYWLAPVDECPCDRTHHPILAGGLINDPQKPTHDDDCRWYLTYRLRWWR